VPKCGGNSIRIALREAYNLPLSDSRRRFFHVSPRRSRSAAEAAGRPVAELRDEQLRTHLADARVRLFTGHFHWPPGLRDSFPDVSVVILLRDPVSRFLSAYYDGRGGSAGAAAGTRGTLDDYLDSERARRNGATYARIFAWADPGHALDPAVLDLARRRLSGVEVIGVLEDLPSFVAAFEARFGARLIIPRANVGGRRRLREKAEITAPVVERIAELVRPDQVLYDFVQSEIARRATGVQER